MASIEINQILISRISRKPEYVSKELVGIADLTGALQTFYLSSPDDIRLQLIVFLPSEINKRALMTFYPLVEISGDMVHTGLPIVDRTINLDRTHIFPVPGMGVIKVEHSTSRWDLFRLA